MGIGIFALAFSGICGVVYLVMAPHQGESVYCKVDYQKIYAKLAPKEL